VSIPHQSEERASDQAAAEDLRRQFQARHAANPETILLDRAAFLPWIGSRQDRLLQISNSVGLTGKDAIAAAEAYTAIIAGAKTRTEFDDPNWEHLIAKLRAKIETACAVLNIPLNSGVVVGVNPTSGFNASQYRVPLTNASILSLDGCTFHLCSLTSKAMARSLIYARVGEEQSVSFDSEQVLEKIKRNQGLLGYWASIIFSFAIFNGPQLVPFELQNPNEAQTRFQLLEAMELFVIAHELGHHVAGQVDLKNFPIPASATEQHGEEYRADLIAGAILVYLGGKPNPINLFAGSAAAPVLLLSIIDMIVRMRTLLCTKRDTRLPSESHPLTSERIAALDILDKFVHESERHMLTDIRNCFVKILNGLWIHLRDQTLSAPK
jgi:hypothetical protein